jgi:hypothetical protein
MTPARVYVKAFARSRISDGNLYKKSINLKHKQEHKNKNFRLKLVQEEEYKFKT